MFQVLQCGFRVTFGRALNHLEQVSGDLRVSFGCAGVGLGRPSGALRVLLRGFWVTFGRVSGALVWISNDLRGRFGCSGAGVG